MPFAPHEIENKTFVLALRGYHTEEVQAFLRAVAADYGALLEQVRRREVDHRELADVGRIMRVAREEAERDAAQLRAQAEAEAAAIREAAALESAELRASAQREVEECLAEIARRTEQLHALEALYARLHAIDRKVIEGRSAHAYGDTPNLAAETNVGDAMAVR